MADSGLHLLRPDEAVSQDASPSAPRILLIEDDASVRDSLGEALRHDGFDVATACDGRDAIERMRNGCRPAAILLDLMMPVMDGWDFRQHQLNDPTLREIPVVVITAVNRASRLPCRRIN